MKKVKERGDIKEENKVIKKIQEQKISTVIFVCH